MTSRLWVTTIDVLSICPLSFLWPSLFFPSYCKLFVLWRVLLGYKVSRFWVLLYVKIPSVGRSTLITTCCQTFSQQNFIQISLVLKFYFQVLSKFRPHTFKKKTFHDPPFMKNRNDRCVRKKMMSWHDNIVLSSVSVFLRGVRYYTNTELFG